ncbi:hemolysin XhlA family protein [Clostridium thermobutyricum]|uniref:hemolysin XhlA family protein n=1 Tax=Clostridium thermobutyricum TaxID=29372 RepID=UPI0018A9549B|nr:hemolysin XhlA family protein [Clostridium thermobutyricum]
MDDEFLRDKLETHDNRLNDHSERLKNLEQSNVELKVEIKNLCEAIKQSNNIMRIFITLFGTGLVGFFFYIIEQHLH